MGKRIAEQSVCLLLLCVPGWYYIKGEREKKIKGEIESVEQW